MRAFRLILIGCLIGATGCAADGPVNPSFAVSTDQAKKVLSDFSAHPAELDRPLVIIGGFSDPGIAPLVLKSKFHRYTSGRRILGIELFFCASFSQCRDYIVQTVDYHFPTSDPRQTVAVDVIGFSMGGLAARYSAADFGPGRRLRINRLFTIDSPLTGSVRADMVPGFLLPVLKSMQTDSKLIRALEQNPQRSDDLYPIYSYVRLGDRVVGEDHASLPGTTAWWVATPPLGSPHAMAYDDPRILADIACRLTGRPPLSSDPPAPLPDLPWLPNSPAGR